MSALACLILHAIAYTYTHTHAPIAVPIHPLPVAVVPDTPQALQWDPSSCLTPHLKPYPPTPKHTLQLPLPASLSWLEEVGFMVPVLDLANHANKGEATARYSVEYKLSAEKQVLLGERPARTGSRCVCVCARVCVRLPTSSHCSVESKAHMCTCRLCTCAASPPHSLLHPPHTLTLHTSCTSSPSHLHPAHAPALPMHTLTLHTLLHLIPLTPSPCTRSCTLIPLTPSPCTRSCTLIPLTPSPCTRPCPPHAHSLSKDKQVLPRITLTATRDLNPGDEITFSYLPDDDIQPHCNDRWLLEYGGCRSVAASGVQQRAAGGGIVERLHV